MIFGRETSSGGNISESGGQRRVGLEDALRNSALTILRDARKEISEVLPLIGPEDFVEHYASKLRPGSVSLPDLPHGVSFSFASNPNAATGADVLFHIPVEGDHAMFTFFSEQFTRTRGTFSADSTYGVRILYRSGLFSSAGQLNMMLREDMELVHQYVLNTMAIREEYHYKLETELRDLVKQFESATRPTLTLAMELEVLGFSRYREPSTNREGASPLSKTSRPSGTHKPRG